MPTRLIGLPAAAQVRNPNTKAMSAMDSRIAHLAPTALVSWSAPQNAATPAMR